MFQINKMLEKEMDRKEFLLTLGVMFLVLTGISGIYNSFKTSNLFGSSRTRKLNGSRFGSGPYGI